MFQIITPPGIEPVSLVDARLHLRIDDDNTVDDTLIAALITAARQSCESATGRALITQTVRQFGPACFPFQLDLNQAQAINSVKVIDTAENESILAPNEYRLGVNLIKNAVFLTPDYTFPLLSRDAVVEYVAGYGAAAADVPGPLKQWILLLIGAMYENREAVTPVNLLEMPVFRALIAPYVIHSGF
jgi:uncharacterized phiE125 gp8 family phage protein